MSDERISEVIKDIATRHGIAVGRDDPILILMTMNDRLARDTAEAHQQLLAEHRQELEDMLFRVNLETKDQAEKIVNASLSAARKAMRDDFSSASEQGAAIIEKAAQKASQTLSKGIEKNRMVGVFNLIAGCLVLAASVIFVLLG